MAVASYHGIRPGEVEFGVGYLQLILWSCTHQPEVRRVPVIVGLQNGNCMRKHDLFQCPGRVHQPRGMLSRDCLQLLIDLLTFASLHAALIADNNDTFCNSVTGARKREPRGSARKTMQTHRRVAQETFPRARYHSLTAWKRNFNKHTRCIALHNG